MAESEKKVDMGTEEEPVKTEKKEKKKNKKDQEIEALRAELEQQKELLVRTAAEFDNFKKRTERERLSVAEFAKSAVIKELLPLLDNIDRSGEPDFSNPDYVKGMELIVKQFMALKERLGVVEIGAVGDEFDPTIHEAVMHIEDENLGTNVISQVLQKGYKFGDTVIRAAMVQVAN